MDRTFFVAPSLPSLVLGETPEITFGQLESLLEVNLSKSSLSLVGVLRRFYDLQNIRSLFLEEPLDRRGSLGEKELDEALLVRADLPDYVFSFLDRFAAKEDQVRHFAGLLSAYYREETVSKSRFLTGFLEFQYRFLLVKLALRAKRVKGSVDLAYQLQFEDPTEPIVASILAQKQMDDYDPPAEFLSLKESLKTCGDDPWEQFRVAAIFEFTQIEEIAAYPLFSLDWILGYVARFFIAQEWSALDPQKGKESVESYKLRSNA